jgi:phosphoribosylaminoimidazole (AIR) synthetase
LAYVIESVPPPQPVFAFMQAQEISTTSAYGNLNMGAGFAIYVPAEKDVALR